MPETPVTLVYCLSDGKGERRAPHKNQRAAKAHFRKLNDAVYPQYQDTKLRMSYAYILLADGKKTWLKER